MNCGSALRVITLTVMLPFILGLTLLSALLFAQKTMVASARAQEKPQAPPDHTDRAAGEAFLNLTIRLHEDGTSEILRATQVEGRLIERKLPVTNYVYEIIKNGKVFAVGFLPDGSFSWRSIKPLEGGNEKTGKTKSATISLYVPNTNLNSAKQGKIGLRIYKIQLGVELETINPGLLKKLLADQKASKQFDLSGAAVAAQTNDAHRVPAEGPN
jgi:hypothetical protein